MSSAAPRPYLIETSSKADGVQPEPPSFDPLLVLRAGCVDTPHSTLKSKAGIRRRATQEQGRALEVIGHSIEYLIDSRMFELTVHNRAAEAEAVQILMRLSRAVFDECAQVVTWRGHLERLAERYLRW